MKFAKLIILVITFIAACSTSALSQSQRQRVELYNTVDDASELKPGENIDEKIRNNFFLKAEVTKKRCFVGEAVMATFKAYSRLDANSQVVKRPSLSGFSVIEMVDAYNNMPEVEKYNGEFYYVHLIRKVQLFPLQPGDFTIESAEVESLIRLRSSDEKESGSRLRNLFRRDRSGRSIQKQVTFKTPEVEIHVDALPGSQPEDFSGAVGNFKIDVAFDKREASQHEPSILTVSIKGAGNFPLITDPVISWPAGVEVAPPVAVEDINKYNFPLSGTKSFQYTLDNNDTGSFVIPPVRLTYFDPSSASYKTIASDSLTYTVSLSDKKSKTIPAFARVRGSSVPLHYYYFGIVVVVIIIVIIYMSVKKNKG